MNQLQTDLRNKMAQKTRRIVARQGPLGLEEFLAQGRKRSRQQRASSEESPPIRLVGLRRAAASL